MPGAVHPGVLRGLEVNRLWPVGVRIVAAVCLELFRIHGGVVVIPPSDLAVLPGREQVLCECQMDVVTWVVRSVVIIVLIGARYVLPPTFRAQFRPDVVIPELAVLVDEVVAASAREHRV